MQGLQDAGTLACAKHFPGHGDTHLDSHQTVPIIEHNKHRLFQLELYPFSQLINAGVAAVMGAHIKVPAFDKKNISTLSYPITTQLLKNRLHFGGLVITDALNMGALNNYAPGIAELHALRAGNDILLCSRDIPRAIALIEKAVLEKKISVHDINEHVLKILQTKEYLGLNKQRHTPITNQELVNTNQGYALKKRLYQEAVTLVQNNNQLVPLHSSHRLLPVIQVGQAVAGTAAEDSFIKKLEHSFSCTVHYVDPAVSPTKINTLVQSSKHSPTVVVALFGMNKLASKNFGITKETLLLLKKLQQHHKKIILVIFGSPYSLKLFNDEDTIIMAYEDDPDAQEAAADIIVGTLQPHGKLPVTASEKFYYGLGLTV